MASEAEEQEDAVPGQQSGLPLRWGEDAILGGGGHPDEGGGRSPRATVSMDRVGSSNKGAAWGTSRRMAKASSWATHWSRGTMQQMVKRVPMASMSTCLWQRRSHSARWGRGGTHRW
jgi:hypothetical protein